MTTLFISDLHLSPEEPAITARFLALLEQAQTGVDALYILGDLFDHWIGDDDTAPYLEPIIAAIKRLSQQIPCYFMAGNRDFLVGKRFCQQTGLILLQEPTIINLYGTPVLLLHGDTLCTDDQEYLAYRAKVRDPKLIARFMLLPLWVRKLIARWLRYASKKRTAKKPPQQLETNETALLQLMREQNVSLLIHGHIHKPGIHQTIDNGIQREWFVLGDWSAQAGSVLVCSASGGRLLKQI